MSKIALSKDDFQAFWEATVRYYELDPQGVMHNANYVAFFDQAITAYFKYVNYDYLKDIEETQKDFHTVQILVCLLYTSPSPRDMRRSRMPSSA